MSTTFLVNVMFFKFNLMFLHTSVSFLALDIKFFKDSQTIHSTKTYPLFHTSMFKCFFFSNWFIADFKIFPTCNFLLNYKHEEKPNIKMTNKNNKYLLLFQLKPCYFIDLVATRLKNC